MRTFSRHLAYLSIILACGALSACATTGNNPSLRTADAGTHHDVAYMAKVNRLATQRGVKVHWINPPRVADRQVVSR